ncbi:MAG: hypothetical protein ACQR33_03050 [Candidatus Saccharibacteria bacterium]
MTAQLQTPETSETRPARSTTFSLMAYIMAAVCVVLTVVFGYEALHSVWQILKHSVLLAVWVFLFGAAIQGVSLSLALRHRELRPIKDVIGLIGGFVTIVLLSFKGTKVVGNLRHRGDSREQINA